MGKPTIKDLERAYRETLELPLQEVPREAPKTLELPPPGLGSFNLPKPTWGTPRGQS